MTLTCPACDGAVRLIDDNGVTTPDEGDRWEQYECGACGHVFDLVLKAEDRPETLGRTVSGP